jgi:hypothetical protein
MNVIDSNTHSPHTQQVFQTMLQRYVEKCGHATVLSCILNAFPALHYADKATAMLALIKQANGAEVCVCVSGATGADLCTR